MANVKLRVLEADRIGILLAIHLRRDQKAGLRFVLHAWATRRRGEWSYGRDEAVANSDPTPGQFGGELVCWHLPTRSPFTEIEAASSKRIG